MKKIFLCLTIALIALTTVAQKEKFDIASFNTPVNWQRLDTAGLVVLQNFQPANNNAVAFCQIFLFPSSKSRGNVTKDFNEEWSQRVKNPTGSKIKPVTEKHKTAEGWDVIMGHATINNSGITYNALLVTATGFGKTMSVLVNTAGGDYTSAIDNFFNELDLDSKTSLSANNNSTMTLGDYEYTPPKGYVVQNKGDHIRMQHPGSGCLIMILAPQASSGDLEQDAIAVFEMMYRGWNYQRTGWQQFTATKGNLNSGLEFYMIEAGMSKLAAGGATYDGFEDGAAVVVKANDKIAIISARHNSSLLDHDACRKYEGWTKFLNSFTVKNAGLSMNAGEKYAELIVGEWSQTEAGASSQYIFAANGNYQLIGALGSSSTSSDYRYEYLHISTYAWKGDGKYSINGNKLKLKRYSNTNEDAITFRIDQVKYGDKPWIDRLVMVRKGVDDGKEYQVSYDRSKN